MDFLINNSYLDGPFNIVAPQPSTNEELMKVMRQTLKVLFGIPSSKPVLKLDTFLIKTETEFLLKSRNMIPT